MAINAWQYYLLISLALISHLRTNFGMRSAKLPQLPHHSFIALTTIQRHSLSRGASSVCAGWLVRERFGGKVWCPDWQNLCRRLKQEAKMSSYGPVVRQCTLVRTVGCSLNKVS